MTRILLAVLSGSLCANVCVADDRDGDGLDDQSVEQMLLDRHRPTLVFEPDERYHPVSILDFVQHSGLVAFYRIDTGFGCNRAGVGNAAVYSEAQIAADPLLVLSGLSGFNPPNPQLVCGVGDTSFVTSPNPPARWRLNINDNYRAPGSGGSFYTGIYGHVVPTGDGRILVQYWLLFPMNEAECTSDCGDHEGDWLYLDVYVSSSPPYSLQSIRYHHHGDGNCPPTVLPYTPPQPCGGAAYCFPVPLPADGHPVCYIEEQAHEWWPWASGGAECGFVPFLCENSSHTGGGLSYTVSSVKNVGEWYAPMPGDLESQLFVLYNGLWGHWGSICSGTRFNPPDSPMVQFFPWPPSWQFLSHGEPAGATGSGTPTDPWRSFSTAATSIGAGNTLRIISGTYTAVGTWNRPMTITATLAPVTLGQ